MQPGYQRAGRALCLRNPGTRARVFVAIGGSAVGVLATALACGGPCYLSAVDVRRIAGRSDEHYRQRVLGLTPDAGARMGA